MLTFKTEKHPTHLIVSLRWINLIWRLGLKAAGLALALFVFTFPYNSIIQVHEYAFLLYFLPLIPLILVIKSAFTFFYHRQYLFVKNKDAIYRNKKLIAQLSAIQHLELEYEGDYEHVKYYLSFITLENERITIFKSFGHRRSLTNIGISIAKFLNVEFINTSPLYDRIIWGGVNANESDINFLENGM